MTAITQPVNAIEALTNQVVTIPPIPTMEEVRSAFRTGIPQILSTMVRNLLLISTTSLSPFLMLQEIKEGVQITDTVNDQVSNPITDQISGTLTAVTDHLPFSIPGIDSASLISYVNMAIVPIGALASGFITNKFGMQLSMQIMLALLVVVRTLNGIYTSGWEFYATLIGINLCCEFFKGPILTGVAETAQPHLRGALTATACLSMAMGQFQQLVMNTFVNPSTAVYINCAMPIACILLLFIVPETPHRLIMANKLDEARKSLAWLRGWVPVEEIEPEFQELLAHCRSGAGKTASENISVSDHKEEVLNPSSTSTSVTAIGTTATGIDTQSLLPGEALNHLSHIIDVEKQNVVTTLLNALGLTKIWNLLHTLYMFQSGNLNTLNLLPSTGALGGDVTSLISSTEAQTSSTSNAETSILNTPTDTLNRFIENGVEGQVASLLHSAESTILSAVPELLNPSVTKLEELSLIRRVQTSALNLFTSLLKALGLLKIWNMLYLLYMLQSGKLNPFNLTNLNQTVNVANIVGESIPSFDSTEVAGAVGGAVTSLIGSAETIVSEAIPELANISAGSTEISSLFNIAETSTLSTATESSDEGQATSLLHDAKSLISTASSGFLHSFTTTDEESPSIDKAETSIPKSAPQQLKASIESGEGSQVTSILHGCEDSTLPSTINSKKDKVPSPTHGTESTYTEDSSPTNTIENSISDAASDLFSSFTSSTGVLASNTADRLGSLFSWNSSTETDTNTVEPTTSASSIPDGTENLSDLSSTASSAEVDKDLTVTEIPKATTHSDSANVHYPPTTISKASDISDNNSSTSSSIFSLLTPSTITIHTALPDAAEVPDPSKLTKQSSLPSLANLAKEISSVTNMSNVPDLTRLTTLTSDITKIPNLSDLSDTEDDIVKAPSLSSVANIAETGSSLANIPGLSGLTDLASDVTKTPNLTSITDLVGLPNASTLTDLTNLSNLPNIAKDLSKLAHLPDIPKSKLLEEGLEVITHINKYASRTFLIPLAIITFTYVLINFTGTTIMLNHPEKILVTLRVPLHPKYAVIILSGANILGTSISISAIKAYGKRKLTFISLAGIGTCSLVISSYSYFEQITYHTAENVKIPTNFSLSDLNITNWIPLAILLLLSTISHFGLNNLPVLLVGELFSKDTRTIGTGVSNAITSYLNSLCNSGLVFLLASLDFPGLYCFYGAVSFVGIIILHYILPETEGKSLEHIEDHFKGSLKLGNVIKKFKPN